METIYTYRDVDLMGWEVTFDKDNEVVESTYPWTNKGNYKIKAKAKDIYYIESKDHGE